jgi:Dyp-type peroxidase family
VVGKPGDELDLLIIVAGDEREPVTAEARSIMRRLAGVGARVASQDGDVREGSSAGHEHFGFDDGVSQPGIRGRASAAADDFITDRHINTSDIPAAWLYGYPGQDLVWPGEFVLGYPATAPDPLVPGPFSEARPAWTRNGSFLVYRRLRQDVGLFWRTMRDEASRLAKLDGFQGLTEDRLAARLVGRWQSGAPFNRVPAGDNEDLGNDPFANNNLLFDSDTPPVTLANGRTDPYDGAKADPVGITCPWAAHIRKVNLRDSGSDIGGRVTTYSRRLLRVGVAFGKSLEDRYGAQRDPQNGDRGLLFLSIQASIENQFEFLQARWMNDPSRPKMPGGHDMIVGQNATADGGVRRCTIFGSGLQSAEVSAARQFVIPTGGGYFFVPSLSALREVIAG